MTTCEFGATQLEVFDLQSIALPTTRSDFAYDVDGNGTPENQLGNIVGVLLTVGLDPQAEIDGAFLGGTIPTSLSLLTDPSLPASFGAIFGQSLPQHEQAVFCGSVADGRFSTVDTSEEVEPGRLLLTLPFVEGISIHVVGAQLAFIRKSDVVTGQLHGAIPVSEMRSQVYPATARLMTKKLAGDPQSTFSRELASIYDTGGGDDESGCSTSRDCGSTPVGSSSCRNPPPPVGDGHCADACDHVIDPCEVERNNITRNVTAADVQLFTDDGTQFRPNPERTHKDSVSLGIAFTAKLRQ